MELERKEYLQKLIDKKDNGRVKIVTGIRRCGKSYLLFELYTKYLQEHGVESDQIIGIALDELAKRSCCPRRNGMMLKEKGT